MNKSINSFFALLTILIFSACSSVQITEEAVADQSVTGVSIASKSTATQAVLANAVVYFEYDQYNLTAKSIQALKGVSDLMKRNAKKVAKRQRLAKAGIKCDMKNTRASEPVQSAAFKNGYRNGK